MNEVLDEVESLKVIENAFQRGNLEMRNKAMLLLQAIISKKEMQVENFEMLYEQGEWDGTA